ncbi:hypothetical protein [Nocardioides donggukensis]|uniref:WD40 repeat domain-containing protein n=1 Tax=Nocardioides donggukensis TaxID=2774019 RepID=A0A927K5Q4_9ACTN|nr:hypothetical protein [Nocardioides donggukensis]MBD8870724.1 hypothetical protein [Nocardioides donggukensis]
MRELLALGAVGLTFALGAAATPTAEEPELVVRLADPEILESSGLVVDGDLAVTVNDSGDGSRIFTVDLGTGETVGTTTWPGESVDNEALAPAGPDRVWVADIGDNRRARDAVTVTRVPYGTGSSSAPDDAFTLTYPGGRAADAEALLRHPVTGRLYVVTKGVVGGSVYAAPSDLRPEGTNRMDLLGPAPGLVTDGAFLPDGEHLVLRNYSQAFVLTFPELESVGDFRLPDQEQGEGLAVGADERLYLSSEGARSPILRLALPDDVREAMAAAAAPPTPPTASPEPEPGPPVPPTSASDFQRDPWQWAAGGLVFVVAFLLLILSLRPR